MDINSFLFGLDQIQVAVGQHSIDKLQGPCVKSHAECPLTAVVFW